MTETVAVLGAGYGGAGVVSRLERALPDADLVWVSEHDYHLVLHEVHRVVRDPAVREHVTIPVEAIASSTTEFVEGTVTGLDTDARLVTLADGSTVAYDYALVALGSETAFYGIPGLREHAHTLKSLDDALAIHEAVTAAASEATPAAPARVVVGGAGLSGIQTAGEVAALRDDRDLPVDIHLVEALDEVLPNGHPDLQARLRGLLARADVHVRVDDPIVEATGNAVTFETDDALPYDVLVWTGGITGRECLADAGLDNNHARLRASADFRTSDDRVFAVGDTALVEQDGHVAPPTAQAAWDAADAAADNLVRAIEGRPLEPWTHDDQGTLVSVGEDAVAHDVPVVPVETFGGPPARFLKKAAAARWIASIASYRRAMTAWDAL